jgi:ELWxxDGT repeat protein
MENITAFKNGYPLRYPVVGGKLFFPGVTDADYYQHHYELWTSDGTDAGTSLVKDIYFGNETSKIYEMTAFKDKVYFGATDGPSNNEVWLSDGTESGTKMLKDIYVGGTSDPAQFTPVDSLMYFVAYDEPNKLKLYRTNGTEAGTYHVPLTIQMQPTMQLYSGDSILYWTDYGKLYRLGKGSEPNGIKEELADAASFSVYPNPSTGSFSVTLNGLQNESAILLITDLSGREAGAKIPVNIHAGENTMLINTALKPGLYTITLSMRSGVLSKRLFIVN